METEGAFVHSIYYGRIGSKDTEKLLKMYGQDGSFLLRDSTTVPGAYCLCVRKTPYVHTYRLERCSDGWFIQDSRDRLQKFTTVELLIRHYRGITASSVGIAPLTDPLDRTQVPHSFLQGIVYMEMNSDSRSAL